MEKISSSHLTALILTFNEEDNIDRVLKKLSWLERVVVLDSYSTDNTISLVSQYPNVDIFYRKFDTHATQWNYGLSLTKSKWVLTLDADYVLTSDFIQETKNILQNNSVVACFSSFKFAVFGKPLSADNTTPRPVLFKPEFCTYYDDGHTQRLKIDGKTNRYKSYIIHDDQKPLTRWLINLNNYSIKECHKLLHPETTTQTPTIIKIRKTKIFAPILVFFYCLFFKGLILDGWAGWHYTLQRTMVEMLFALRLIEEENLKRKLFARETKPPESIINKNEHSLA